MVGLCVNKLVTESCIERIAISSWPSHQHCISLTNKHFQIICPNVL